MSSWKKLGKPKAISQQFMVRQVNASAGYNGCFGSFFRSPRSVNDKLLSRSSCFPTVQFDGQSNWRLRWMTRNFGAVISFINIVRRYRSFADECIVQSTLSTYVAYGQTVSSTNVSRPDLDYVTSNRHNYL